MIDGKLNLKKFEIPKANPFCCVFSKSKLEIFWGSKNETIFTINKFLDPYSNFVVSFKAFSWTVAPKTVTGKAGVHTTLSAFYV
jgi:hypothetical protein